MPAAIWKALPASYRAAATDAVKGFAGKMDPAVWKAGQETALQIAATIVKQNALLAEMAGEGGAPVPGDLTADEMKSFLVKGGAKLGAVARAATLEKLAAGDLQGLLDTPALSMKGVTDAVADIVVPSYAASANEDGSVTMTNKEKPDDTDRMVKVEGVWLPEPLAEAFKEKDSWKAAVEKIEPLTDAQKQQATMMLGMLKGVAQNAGKATTSEQLQGAVMQGLMPLMMMGGAMGGGMGGGAPVPVSFGDDDDEE